VFAVAHFRRKLFISTETFLYTYLSSFSRIIPVCITFQKASLEQFPYSHPLVELYSWNIWSRGWRWLGQRIWQDKSELRYDLPRTSKALRQHDVRVLHAHFGYTGSQVLPVKEKTGLPLVTTFYGEDISALARLDRWQRAYSELFNRGDFFLVEGPHMQKQLLNIGCPPGRAGIQRIALKLDRYPFRQRLPKGKTGTIRLLFCGSFREKKGLVHALDAARIAHERFPKLEFYVLGDGELRLQVEQRIERYQMASYTHLLGFQSHQRMIEEMTAADIFISPSVTAANGDSEGGAPTTILEAQSCGVPVLSTDHADIPNVVMPGQSALLAPEGDTETLGKNLCTLLAEPERWAEMGRHGRAFVERYHNITCEIRSLEELYSTLAKVSLA